MVARNYISASLMSTGNGYIGVEVSPASQLYIKSGRTLSFPVRFYPVVEVSLEGYHTSGISVSHMHLMLTLCSYMDCQSVYSL